MSDEVPEIQDKPEAQPIQTVSGRIEIQDLKFNYQSGQDVLSGFHFR